jgi:transcriptional accessory protein Tex/SPT6
LKRLQPNPWDLAAMTYTAGQIVSGTVTSVADFGAFVLLDIGIEGLVHVSELASPAPQTPREIVQRGDVLVLRVLRVEPHRRRIALSLKRVDAQEREDWLAQQERKAPEEASDFAETFGDLDPEAVAFWGDAAASPYDPPEGLPGDQSARPPEPNSEEYWKSLLEEEL